MIAVGIDPGTSCGVAVVTDAWVAWTTLHLPSWRHHEGGLVEGPVDCGRVLWSALRELVVMVLAGDEWPDIHAAIEDSQHAASMRAAAVQAEHLQTIAQTCRWLGGDVTPVHPARWQHDVVGGLGRAEYVRFARELTGGELGTGDHDAAAAICIAEWCWRQHAGGER